MTEPAKTVRERIAALSRGFRSEYLRYDDLTAQLTAWAEAFPDVVRLSSLVETVEGRCVWLLTIGRDPDRIRPAAWVDGNMHACELAGSSVALAIAEDLIVLLSEEGASLYDVPVHLAELLRQDVLFYVVPRICPDGAEHFLGVSSYVRSNPRDRRHGKTAPYFRGADVDGDGRARLMRVKDPAGQFSSCPDNPDILWPREIDDPGPYYSVYPEGYIENWDGHTIPGYHFLDDNETDLNRNFPFRWAPEPRQAGAGAYPAREPESRAIVEFATEHPNIFAWLNLHTYGGCYIRPSGDLSDRKMDQSDLWVFQQIERFATPITGYPIVSGAEEFTYEPDTPLCGDLATFAYEQRGTIAMVCELWDFWKQVGIQRASRFAETYIKRTRDDVRKIIEWDREHNKGRFALPFRPFDHPQLGPVEIGGYEPLIGVWNPPKERLAEVCESQARVFLRWAALAPRVRITDLRAEKIADGIHIVTATVENIGFLPTFVLSSSQKLPWNDPVRVKMALSPGVTLAGGDAVTTIGHLSGWSPDPMFGSPTFLRTTTQKTRAHVQFLVRGEGEITLTASSARIGKTAASIAIATETA